MDDQCPRPIDHLHPIARVVEMPPLLLRHRAVRRQRNHILVVIALTVREARVILSRERTQPPQIQACQLIDSGIYHRRDVSTGRRTPEGIPVHAGEPRGGCRSVEVVNDGLGQDGAAGASQQRRDGGRFVDALPQGARRVRRARETTAPGQGSGDGGARARGVAQLRHLAEVVAANVAHHVAEL